MEAGETKAGTDIPPEAAAAAALDVIPARGPAAYIAEFIGTFALVLFVTLVVSLFGTLDFGVLGLVHVLVLFMLIQTLAVVSGAHFNPAITAALTVIRQIRPIDAAIYIVVQLAGGVLGGLLTKGILSNFKLGGMGTPVTRPAKDAFYGAAHVSGPLLGHKVGLAMIVEGIGAFFLIWAVVGVAVNPSGLREWAGLVIGGTLGFIVMVGGPLTGGSFNPARAFGPALVAHHFGGAGRFILIYALAPVIGGVLAALAYMQMFVLPGKKGPFGMGPVG